MKKILYPKKINVETRRIEKKYPGLLEKLSKSEQEKAVILDAMTELVLYLDTDLKVIWANKDSVRAGTGPVKRSALL